MEHFKPNHDEIGFDLKNAPKQLWTHFLILNNLFIVKKKKLFFDFHKFITFQLIFQSTDKKT